MSTTQTPLECAFAFAEARISAMPWKLPLQMAELKAAHESMKPHRTGFETVVDAALRIITEDHRRLMKAQETSSAMNARLHLQLTAALEQVAVEHRGRIKAI